MGYVRGISIMYEVKFTESVVNELKKFEPVTQRMFKNWTVKTLVDTTEPTRFGTKIKGTEKDVYRYVTSNCFVYALIEGQSITIIEITDKYI